MERGLFLDTERQNKIESLGLSIQNKDLKEFQELFSAELKKNVFEILETLDEKLKKNLYFLGSFGLDQPSLFSDLDLCFIGELNFSEKNKLDDLLRGNFRKYSLLIVKNFEDLKTLSNFKTLVSLRSMEPVFDGAGQFKEDVLKNVLEPKLSKVKELVKEETQKRRSRFGEESGRLLFSFKTASGGMLDLKTLDLCGIRDVEKERFIYKIRVLNQILYKKDQFYVTHASRLHGPMGFESEVEFFSQLFKNLRLAKEMIDEALFEKTDWLEQAFSELNLKISDKEKESYLKKVNALWGRVNSPNYHIFTVGQHLKVCLSEMVSLISLEGKKHSLSDEEKEVLLWSALFHDLGKDQTEIPHSKQGAVYAQEFGRDHGWSPKKNRAVSWLVREHLTLARHAFKMDAFNPELLEKLSLRGVSGTRAVMLYYLTIADTKATNPKSWSEFKKDILTAVLKKALGSEGEFKQELLQVVPRNRVFLVQGLGLKEIALVPHSFLSEDLKGELNEGFKVYEKLESNADGSFWIRYYSKNDRLGLAFQVLTFLNSVGVYVDLALFSTKLKEGVVYNWFKVQSSLSFKAFERRLSSNSIFKAIDASGDTSKAKLFDAIQIRYKTHNYAVLSFKGSNQPKLLLAAVEVLAGASMSILWGHAVTWGEDVEDVFGVSFTEESDWSFVQV